MHIMVMTLIVAHPHFEHLKPRRANNKLSNYYSLGKKYLYNLSTHANTIYFNLTWQAGCIGGCIA